MAKAPTDNRSFCRIVSTILPKHVAMAAGNLDGDFAIFPEEQVFVSNAVPKRQAEFRAGRHYARQALATLTRSPPMVIPVGPGREPVWPKGIVGSISHCDEICWAAVTHEHAVRSLGIDVERSDPLDEQLLGIVCTLEDIRGFQLMSQLPVAVWAKVAFSAKESYYKCHYPLGAGWLGFHDITVRFTDMGGYGKYSVEGAGQNPDPLFRGSWLLYENHIFTSALLPLSGYENSLLERGAHRP